MIVRGGTKSEGHRRFRKRTASTHSPSFTSTVNRKCGATGPRSPRGPVCDGKSSAIGTTNKKTRAAFGKGEDNAEGPTHTRAPHGGMTTGFYRPAHRESSISCVDGIAPVAALTESHPDTLSGRRSRPMCNQTDSRQLLGCAQRTPARAQRGGWLRPNCTAAGREAERKNGSNRPAAGSPRTEL